MGGPRYKLSTAVSRPLVHCVTKRRPLNLRYNNGLVRSTVWRALLRRDWLPSGRPRGYKYRHVHVAADSRYWRFNGFAPLRLQISDIPALKNRYRLRLLTNSGIRYTI